MAQVGENANNGYVLLAQAVVKQSLGDIRSPEATNGWGVRNWSTLRLEVQAEATAWWQSDEPRWWCQAAGFDYDKLATRLWYILGEGC